MLTRQTLPQGLYIEMWEIYTDMLISIQLQSHKQVQKYAPTHGNKTPRGAPPPSSLHKDVKTFHNSYKTV